MGDPPSLELADGYLDEAEDLLWAAASESDSDEVSAPIEALTQDVWALQSRLEALQEEFDA